MLDRRGFLAGLGGLVVVAQLPLPAHAEAADTGELNAFVAIAPDGTVTIAIPSVEMGQGVITALPQLVADELDVPFDQITVAHAPVKKELRTKVAVIREQLTGGSMSVRMWYRPLQEAGATARQMLILAAAERWGVDPSTCTTDAGVVSHPSGKSASYGELAGPASRMKAPKDVPLRQPGNLVGKSVPRQDLRDKVTGAARFGIDVRIPGMVRASVRACPSFGGRIDRVDPEPARAIAGVTDVLVFDDFVAVVADTWWAAEQGCRALNIEWIAGNRYDEERIRIDLDGALERPGRKGLKRGKALKQLGDSPLQATYSVPYLDHAPLEPLNCTVHIDGETVHVWTGTQVQTRTVKAVTKLTGLKDVRLTTTLLGGGFGRRGNVDITESAVRIAMKLGKPVQVLWSREECTRHGFYRPAAKARLQGRVGNGYIQALHIRVASDNFLYRYLPEALVGLVGAAATFPSEGLREGECPYQVPHHQVEYSLADLPVPIGPWRSVGHSYNAFFLESFVDELAHAAKADPVAFRLSHIEDERYRRVIEAVAERAGWGEPPEGRSQGFAMMECYGSVCAQVAEVEIVDGRPRVRRVFAAVDCGPVVNPDIVEAQLMGGVCFGLSAALGEQLTVEDGGIQQSNFHDYPLLRMSDAPEVIGFTVSGPDSPVGGIGELGTPPIAPAVCNAIFAATGQRIRSLPILKHFDPGDA